MKKILIVEDEDIQRSTLKKCLSEKFPCWMICAAKDYESAENLILSSINDGSYFSLFLLDVQLKDDPCDFGGFVLAETVRRHEPYYQVPILFLTSVTTKTGYALSNFHCYNYITKPYSSRDIIEQIRQMLMTGYLKEESITVTDTNHVHHRILLNDLYYIEARSHMLAYHTAYITVTSRSSTLDSISRTLPGNFIKCHRKFVVNTDKITNCDHTARMLALGGDSIPFSRTYKAQLSEALEEHS